MKKKKFYEEPVTLEDLVFENRNKEYGAYSLNKQRRKFLMTAFLISLAFLSTTVAVPLINIYRGGGIPQFIDPGRMVVLTRIVPDKEVIPPPLPPPAPVPDIKKIIYQPPVIVEEPDPASTGFGSNADLLTEIKNLPVPEPPDNIVPPDKEIDEPEPPYVQFPEEPASFNNGDLNEFRKWVLENVHFPQAAVDNMIFGTVYVEFCVNAKGEVVDIKVVRSVDPLVDNETIRTISSSPLWKAARQGGRPVKQRFFIPVAFKVMGNSI
jgi:protein TonB